jgi:hypothetical protein
MSFKLGIASDRFSGSAEGLIPAPLGLHASRGNIRAGPDQRTRFAGEGHSSVLYLATAPAHRRAAAHALGYGGALLHPFDLKRILVLALKTMSAFGSSKRDRRRWQKYYIFMTKRQVQQNFEVIDALIERLHGNGSRCQWPLIRRNQDTTQPGYLADRPLRPPIHSL